MTKSLNLEETKCLIEEDLIKHWELYWAPRELAELDAFRVYYMYLPDTYLPSPPLDMSKEQPLREFESFMHIIALKQKMYEHSNLLETYLRELGSIYKFRRRVIDSIWFIDREIPLEPLVVKLATGATLIPFDINLRAIVEKLDTK